MNLAQSFELLLLAAIWGASFLFMRVSAADFGPIALAGARVAGAALFLWPIVQWRREASSIRQHWRAIAMVGVVGSALPFLFYAVAVLAVSTGVASILNATTPLWGALILWIWLGERLSPSQVLGLALGVSGVTWLAWDQASFKPGQHGVSPAIAVLACLGATLCYGFVAAYTKRRLAGVPPMAVAAGSQMAAAVALVGPALAWRPAQMPGPGSWWAVAALAVLCTGVAYVLYFRLIATIGAARATTVTFLIPLFAVFWGAIFLGEAVTLPMVAACGLILAGTGLSTGFVAWPGWRRKAS